MQNFNVNMSEAAKQDLSDIVDYLSDFSNTIAERYFELIMKKVGSLGIFPTGHALVQDPDLREAGYRWASVRNYTLFFVVYEEKELVVVERILYSRRAYDAIL